MIANTSSSRREFLLSSGVFAAGTVMPSVAIGQQQQAASQPVGEDQIRPPATQAVAIGRSDFAAAEKLAGIQFTDSERDLMAQSINEQLAILASRQKLPEFPNELAPASHFDPRLPGAAMGQPDAPVDVEMPRFADPAGEDDIAFAPVTKLASWLRHKQVSSTDLTKLYLERLKRHDPKLKCVITLCEEQALKQAKAADDEIALGRFRSLLHGIPWGAKDLLDTGGIKTTWGAEPFRDRVPTKSAAVVKALDDAGAVLVAKLSLGALAYNDTWFGGRTNNPWNLKQGSSGSSAGSAAATAAGLVGFSLGTETYGSITSPCLRCGTTGLRPTFGRVSRAGAMALCWSLDKIGPICRTVEDCALVFKSIHAMQPDSDDPSTIAMPFEFDRSREIKGIRIGYDPAWFEGQESNDLGRAALEALKQTGVNLVEIKLPDWPFDVLLNILLCEAAASFENLTRSNRDDELTWQAKEAWPNTFRQTWFIPGIELVQTDRFRRQCMRMMADQMNLVQMIFGPSFAGSLCLITNNTGHPSLTLRTGMKADGTPHAATLVGRLFDEAALCRVGMALEQRLAVWDRRPNLTT